MSPARQALKAEISAVGHLMLAMIRFSGAPLPKHTSAHSDADWQGGVLDEP